MSLIERGRIQDFAFEERGLMERGLKRDFTTICLSLPPPPSLLYSNSIFPFFIKTYRFVQIVFEIRKFCNLRLFVQNESLKEVV